MNVCYYFGCSSKILRKTRDDDQVVKALPYSDPRPIETMVRDVLRSFRDHPQYMKMGHVRVYHEALACFQLRCAVVQWPDK